MRTLIALGLLVCTSSVFADAMRVKVKVKDDDDHYYVSDGSGHDQYHGGYERYRHNHGYKKGYSHDRRHRKCYKKLHRKAQAHGRYHKPSPPWWERHYLSMVYAHHNRSHHDRHKQVDCRDRRYHRYHESEMSPLCASSSLDDGWRRSGLPRPPPPAVSSTMC